jgi:hypothetical protein
MNTSFSSSSTATAAAVVTMEEELEKEFTNVISSKDNIPIFIDDLIDNQKDSKWLRLESNHNGKN